MGVIRATTIADIVMLPAIERSAGEAFRRYPQLAWIADDEVMPEAEHARLVALRASWVARRDSAANKVCGFLCAEPFVTASGVRELHIWELAVASAEQGQGIGRALMRHVIEYARGQHGNDVPCSALTLTTFRDVKFNAPFYAGLGFVVLEEREDAGGDGDAGAIDAGAIDVGALDDQRLGSRLREVLAAEAAHGLPAESRCAMRLSIRAI